MKKETLITSDKNQNGSILMITLIMLLLASIIGFIAIKTATTGLSIAGNYRSGLQAFYTADSVSKYTIVRTNPSPFDMSLYAAPLSSQAFTDQGLPGATSALSALFPANNLTSTVTYLSSGAPPPGSGVRSVRVNYFLVKTTVTGTNKSKEVQEAIYSSIVTKSCSPSC